MPPYLRLLFVAFATMVPILPALAGETAAPLWTEPRTGLDFVRLPAGCFAMGANAPGELGEGGHPRPPRADEVPRHEVCVDEFWLATTEVTVAAWQRVMPERKLTGAARQPAIGVSWDEAGEFVRRLNENLGGERFRLPTEAEWEYGCTPGEPRGDFELLHGPREAELLARAHFRGPIRDDPETGEVATREANAFGLFDMLGNAWEWTADAYHADAYRRHQRSNPHLDNGGSRRVLRGGSYRTDLYQTRCGARAWGLQHDRLPSAGFRLVREIRGPARAAPTK